MLVSERNNILDETILLDVHRTGGSNSNAAWSSLSWNKDKNLEETV